jgi:hypothetical protein
MAATAGGKLIYKPSSDGQLNPGGLSVLLPFEAEGAQDVRIVDEAGNTIEQLQRGVPGKEGVKFYSRKPGKSFGQNLKISVDGKEFDIPDGGQRYEGSFGGDSGLAPVNKSTGGGLSPVAAGAGAAPAFLLDQFPGYVPSLFDPAPMLQAAFQDPSAFAEEYGVDAVESIIRNQQEAERLGLRQLETELEGLQNFAPAAAALKRRELSADQEFNQALRTQQIRSTLPGVQRNLEQQTQRAAAYAEGRLPSAIEDEALTVASRSRAADMAAAGGFGTGSPAAMRLSDRLSAEERLQLAQYGDRLIGENAVSRQNLELAPTAYSDAGSQLQVRPEVGAGRATAAYADTLNQRTTLSAGQALEAAIQQTQFNTTLGNNINQFNASTGLQNAQFNTQNQFAAQLGAFNYLQGYAANLASLQTAQINQDRAQEVRDKLTAIYQDSKTNQQTRDTIREIIGVIGKIPGIADVVSDITDFFEDDTTGVTVDDASIVDNQPEGAVPTEDVSVSPGATATPDVRSDPYSSYNLGVDLNLYEQEVAGG